MDLESFLTQVLTHPAVAITSAIISTALIGEIGYLLYDVYRMDKNERGLKFVPNINYKINNNYH